MMSVVGSLGELMRIQATEEMGGVEQVWMYQDGHLQSKVKFYNVSDDFYLKQ